MSTSSKESPLYEARHLGPIAQELRKTVVSMLHCAGSGHCGGSLSSVEILTVLYYRIMNIDPLNPGLEARDRFIASKGHCAPVLYAVLAKRGFFDEKELFDLRKIDHFLQGHPDMKRVPGVDMSTGSLGLGLSVGNGMALSARLRGRAYTTYVLLGDGELQEGQVWEAAMSASKYKLDNLVAVLDLNGVQLDGCVDEIMPIGDAAAKWRTFGWRVFEADGHDLSDLDRAIAEARDHRGSPAIVIARTVKGKGISFMEGRYEWHGKAVSDEDFRLAMTELDGASYG